jgi:chemotaxis protein methyltransferase CheR
LEGIYARYGYDLREYSEASMRRRVKGALARSGLGDLGALQHRVLTDPDFFSQVREHLTVRVSAMFRDPDFFLAFRTHVVPVLRTYPLLKIWICGCANGEEIYSMAILLAEEGLYERTQLYATDLSPLALRNAKQGLYSSQRLEEDARNHRLSGGRTDFSSYFTAAYEGIAMNASLRRNVLYFQHNLVSDHAIGEMHAILCRNVLIYFGPGLRQRVTAKLGESLYPGGFLCLGTSERMVRTQPEAAFSEVVAGQRIYRQR